MASLLFLFLVSLLSFGACQKSQLQVAFAYTHPITDMSWTWRVNQGRMYMAAQLLDLYPGLTLQTHYLESMDDNARPPNCPSMYETWAKAQMDIIFGTAYGMQYCMASLAPKYPSTLWFPLLGDLNLTLPNWGLGVGNVHQTLFLAGMVAGRETKTGKVGACMPIPIPQSYGHLAAFAQGVAYVNASVQIIAAWSNVWLGPQRDVFIVQRMVAHGIDVIWHRCGTFEGVNEAVARRPQHRVQLRLHDAVGGVGADLRILQLGPPLPAGCPPRGGRQLHKGLAGGPVPRPGEQRGRAVGPLLPRPPVHNGGCSGGGGSHPERYRQRVLGPMRTNTGKVVGQAGSCLTLKEIRNLWWEPWNVVDKGHYALPNEVCHPGEQSHWDDASEKYYCTACPAGTYSQANINLTFQEYVCLPCPAEEYAPRNATGCSACPAGYAVTAEHDGCSPVPLATAAVVGAAVGGVVGAVFLAVAIYGGWQMWKATTDLRRLRKQFSNNNVAQECAEAIANFNLESVAWLRTCPNPNKIQQSFLQILEMLTLVKPYIPDHVLSTITQRQPNGGDAQLASPSNRDCAEGGPTLARQSSDAGSVVIKVQTVLPAGTSHHRQGSGSEASSSSRSPRSLKTRSPALHADPRLLPSHGDWVRKRCTYMVVTVAFAAPAGGAEEDQEGCVPLMGQVLGDVIGIAKGFSATIDHVACDRVALHWGLVSSVSEGALKATQAALEMSKVCQSLPLFSRSLLRLSVSVVQGVCNVATISAAGHSFFVVGGPLLWQVHRLAAKGLAGKCQCEVLISESVHGQVQYAVDCMPRCFLGKVLFWQPLKLRAADGAQVDEWMYELHQMQADEADKWCSRSLLNVFLAASQTDDAELLRSEVARLRARFRPQMSPQDEACLELLLAQDRRCGA